MSKKKISLDALIKLTGVTIDTAAKQIVIDPAHQQICINNGWEYEAANAAIKEWRESQLSGSGNKNKKDKNVKIN